MSDEPKTPDQIAEEAGVRTYDPMKDSMKALLFFLAIIVILWLTVR